MTDRLVHRGPDGRGTYVHEGVGLGHRRLAIIGVSDGAQPMPNEDRTVWVTYNGEIYNHLELRAELEADGHTFASSSDTEVIVHGYESWGVDVVERLRGIFAYTLYDAQAGRLICARDRIGVKPLYYHLTPKLFLFGSEPKALLEHPEMPKRPDPEGVNLFLRHGYIPAPYSAFGGMRQVPPGHVMVVESDRVTKRRYWSPPPMVAERRVPDLEATLDAILDESVDIELMSEVPLGAFCSGGIDSSAVAASMARSERLDSAPRTFCVGFPFPEYDESGYSRQVAEHLGLEHSVDMVEATDLGIDLLEKLVEVYDEPFGDASAIPTYYLCMMAKRHVTVALSGDGGDELFAGYGRYRKLADNVVLPAPARAALGVAARLYPRGVRGERRLHKMSGNLGEQYEADSFLFTPPFLADVVEPELAIEPSWRLSRLFDEAPAETAVQKGQWCDLMAYLPSDILVKVDRASMAHALEVRVPLLDHVFADWALQLPASETFGDGRLKVALKAHLARRIPKAIIERPKMGFGVPLERWLGGDGGLVALSDALRSAHPKRRFYAPIRETAFDEVMRRHRNVGDFSPCIWALLFLEKWWQTFFV